MKEKSIKELLEKLNKEYPLTPHTGAGRLFTTVRRMKAEKEFGLPINLRIGSTISVETGKAANEMNEQEWESFFKDLSEQLKRDYPELYQRLFTEENNERVEEKIENYGNGVNAKYIIFTLVGGIFGAWFLYEILKPLPISNNFKAVICLIIGVIGFSVSFLAKKSKN